MTDPPEDHPNGIIRIRGARVHNLRDVDLDIPRDALVVFTGVSGSGKSSLAFDTIHAEGQRRYIEGLSSFARQFLDQLEPPDVDVLDGLPPTVAIDQKRGSISPRSTVGTLTEILDYLRLLYARTGVPHCPKCGKPIRRQTPEQMVAGVMALGEATKVIVLSPIVKGRKGQHLEAFATIRREGLIRARVDGETIEIGDEPPKLAKTKAHSIEAVIDRLVVRDGMRARLAESLDRALKLGDGTVILSVQDSTGAWNDRVLSVNFACVECGLGLGEIEPRSFSFNSPHGACKTCDGLGKIRTFDPDLAFPDGSSSAEKLEHLNDAFAIAKTPREKAALDALRIDTVCPSCEGARIGPEARSVKLGALAIHEVSALPVTECRTFFDRLTFTQDEERIGPPLVREIQGRLGSIDRVGLGYLSLSRAADTLSGGEFQRVRLAGQIGSGLTGVCYILDEPTSGLHPRDTSRLLGSLAELRDAGNTVLVVEHDEDTIRAADWVVDLGPGAGRDGGRIMAEGPPGELDETRGSLTARYLKTTRSSLTTQSDRLARSPSSIEVIGASERNLKIAKARFPIGCITCVTGVSGSGKSTLVQDILGRAVRRHLKLGGPRPGAHESISGLAAIEAMVDVDQSPIGRSPRSTPATFVGVFDEIRRVFAMTKDAKIRGYKPNRFSFNVRGGRCDTCEGQGVRRISMQFLPDLEVPCESCGGQRFNHATLDIRFKGRSIGDVLAMRVDEALAFFDAIPRVKRGIQALHDAGLGYVTLGQSSTTLSGGESQRTKLATGLNRMESSKMLYLLDEPTTGLHFSDVAHLIGVLSRLADLGNTLVVIEHNMDVARASDWIIELGPEGGPNGGRIVAEGTPAQIRDSRESATGPYL